MALAGQGKTKGTVAQMGLTATFNQSMAAIVVGREITPRFTLWWLSSNYQNIRNMAGGDLRDGLNLRHIASIRCPLPSSDEQRAIANFLDRETAQIDALIAKQKALIELLGERRKAVISRMTTRGLNRRAARIPSGSEWFGALPSHWRIVPFKRNLQFLTSGSRGWAEFYSTTGTPFIRVGNLPHIGSSLEMFDTQYVDVPLDSEGSRTVVSKGDILFSITGAYLGLVAVVKDEEAGSYVSQHVALCRIAPGRLDPTYFSYVVQSDAGQRQIQELGYSGTKPQLALSDVSSFVHPLPPISEQLAINAALERATTHIDTLILKAGRGTALLEERRAALITAAVTGKIDVRGAA